MRWPWQRAESHTVAGRTQATNSPAPSPMGWAFLPPLQRTVSEPVETLTRPGDFHRDLTAWRNPTFASRLTHLVVQTAPSGVIDADGGGVGRPASVDAPHPHLPLLPPPRPQVAQRRIATPGPAGPLTSAPLAGLPVVQRSVAPDPAPPDPVEIDVDVDVEAARSPVLDDSHDLDMAEVPVEAGVAAAQPPTTPNDEVPATDRAGASSPPTAPPEAQVPVQRSTIEVLRTPNTRAGFGEPLPAVPLSAVPDPPPPRPLAPTPTTETRAESTTVPTQRALATGPLMPEDHSPLATPQSVPSSPPAGPVAEVQRAVAGPSEVESLPGSRPTLPDARFEADVPAVIEPSTSMQETVNDASENASVALPLSTPPSVRHTPAEVAATPSTSLDASEPGASDGPPDIVPRQAPAPEPASEVLVSRSVAPQPEAAVDDVPSSFTPDGPAADPPPLASAARPPRDWGVTTTLSLASIPISLQRASGLPAAGTPVRMLVVRPVSATAVARAASAPPVNVQRTTAAQPRVTAHGHVTPPTSVVAPATILRRSAVPASGLIVARTESADPGAPAPSVAHATAAIDHSTDLREPQVADRREEQHEVQPTLTLAPAHPVEAPAGRNVMTSVQTALDTSGTAPTMTPFLVQRDAAAESADFAEPTISAATTAPGAPPAAPGAAPAAAGGGPEEIEALASKLLNPMVRRIKAELLIDRERHGLRTDRW